ncbi:hypothetical protein KEM55_001777 [Ascosphaera atra]|nr:hypothetical protein KEM55_001777 [Ascosphaera atra]
MSSLDQDDYFSTSHADSHDGEDEDDDYDSLGVPKTPSHFAGETGRGSGGRENGLEQDLEDKENHAHAHAHTNGHCKTHMQAPQAPSPTTPTGLLDLDVEGHATMMTTSLLEFYCLTRAVEILNARPGSHGQYTRNDPQAKALGKKLYAYKSRFLSSYGVIADGVESDDWGTLRQHYRDSLDTIGSLALEGAGVTGSSTTPDSSRPSSRGPSRGTSRVQSRVPSRGASVLGLANMQKELEANGLTSNSGNAGKAAGEGEFRNKKLDKLVDEEDPAKRMPLRRQLTDKATADAFNKLPPNLSEMMFLRSTKLAPPNPLPPSMAGMEHLQQTVYGAMNTTSRYATEFEEEAMLGKGSYGAVYRAKHHVDGQVYAVKKIPLSEKKLRSLQAKGFQELENILKEIRTLARLEHKNVVRYFGAWVEYTGGSNTASPGGQKTSTPPRKEKSTRNRTSVVDSTFTTPTGRRNTLMDDVVFETEEEMSFGDVFAQQNGNGGSIEDDGIVFEDPSSMTASEGAESIDIHEFAEKPRRPGFPRSPVTVTGASSSESGSREMSSQSHHDTDYSEDVESIPRSFSALHLNGKTKGREAIDGDKYTQTYSTTEDSDSQDEDTDIFSDGLYSAHDGKVTLRKNSQQHDTSPMVTLHIQMSLHPLSLARYLNPPTPTKPSEHHCYHLLPSLKLLLGILDGVEYLHSQGMVHRDLKPANIFLSHSPLGDPAMCALCHSPGDFSTQDTANGVPGCYNTPRIGDFGLVAEISRQTPSNSDKNGTGESSSKPTTPGNNPARPVGTEGSPQKLALH